MSLVAKEFREDIKKYYSEKVFLSAIAKASDAELENIWERPIVIAEGIAAGHPCRLVIKLTRWTDKRDGIVGNLNIFAVNTDTNYEQQIKMSNLEKVLSIIVD